MTTGTEFDNYLKSLGFNSNTSYEVPEDPADAALIAVNNFAREHSEGEFATSTGIIHITGPAVTEHSAPRKGCRYASQLDTKCSRLNRRSD